MSHRTPPPFSSYFGHFFLTDSVCLCVCVHTVCGYMYVWRGRVWKSRFSLSNSSLKKKTAYSCDKKLGVSRVASCLILWPLPSPLTLNHQGEDRCDIVWVGLEWRQNLTTRKRLSFQRRSVCTRFTRFLCARVRILRAFYRSLVQQEVALTRRLMQGISCNAVLWNTAHLFGHLFKSREVGGRMQGVLHRNSNNLFGNSAVETYLENVGSVVLE